MRTLSAGVIHYLARVFSYGLLCLGLCSFSLPTLAEITSAQLPNPPIRLGRDAFIDKLNEFLNYDRPVDAGMYREMYDIEVLLGDANPLRGRAMTLPALALRFLAGEIILKENPTVFRASTDENYAVRSAFRNINFIAGDFLDRIRNLAIRRLSDAPSERNETLWGVIEETVRNGKLSPHGKGYLRGLVRSPEQKSTERLSLVFDTIYITTMVHFLTAVLDRSIPESRFDRDVEASFLKTAKVFRSFILDEVNTLSPPPREIRELGGVLEHIIYSGTLAAAFNLVVFSLKSHFTYPADDLVPALISQGALTAVLTFFGGAQWFHGHFNIRPNQEYNDNRPRYPVNSAATAAPGLCSLLANRWWW